MDEIVGTAAETLITLVTFPPVAKFVKIAAFNANPDVEGGLIR
ncbi:MAG: hypothetical protein PHF20_07385 [Halothiobacillaceae bacterium]|nr:hypothetical protein [Halothiobacillaceae bacterium]